MAGMEGECCADNCPGTIFGNDTGIVGTPVLVIVLAGLGPTPLLRPPLPGPVPQEQAIQAQLAVHVLTPTRRCTPSCIALHSLHTSCPASTHHCMTETIIYLVGHVCICGQGGDAAETEQRVGAAKNLDKAAAGQRHFLVTQPSHLPAMAGWQLVVIPVQILIRYRYFKLTFSKSKPLLRVCGGVQHQLDSLALFKIPVGFNQERF